MNAAPHHIHSVTPPWVVADKAKRQIGGATPNAATSDRLSSSAPNLRCASVRGNSLANRPSNVSASTATANSAPAGPPLPWSAAATAVTPASSDRYVSRLLSCKHDAGDVSALISLSHLQ